MSLGIKGEGDPIPWVSWRTRLLRRLMLTSPKSALLKFAWMLRDDGVIQIIIAFPNGETLIALSCSKPEFDDVVTAFTLAQAAIEKELEPT